MPFCRTVAEALARLEELDSEDDDSSDTVDIFMEPPAADGVVTDEDSDKSDGEYEFNPSHLGRKLLSAGCEVCRSNRIRHRKQAVDTERDSEDDEVPANQSSSAPTPAAAQLHDDCPPNKKCKIEKQRDSPVWTKQKTLPTHSGRESYTGRHFINTITDLTSPLQFF